MLSTQNALLTQTGQLNNMPSLSCVAGTLSKQAFSSQSHFVRRVQTANPTQ